MCIKSESGQYREHSDLSLSLGKSSSVSTLTVDHLLRSRHYHSSFANIHESHRVLAWKNQGNNLKNVTINIVTMFGVPLVVCALKRQEIHAALLDSD